MELAFESSLQSSRYGHYVLGWMYRYGVEGDRGLAQDDAQALALYQLAAAQGLDEAQCSLGDMYVQGLGIPQDFDEALRLTQLAAAHGHPTAFFNVAYSHELGEGFRVNKAEVIRWYRRAQATGCPRAASALQRLHA